MKNYITIFVLFICNFSFAQEYLSSDSQWTEYKVGCGGGGLGITCVSEKYTISLDGDTSINNIVYHKTRRIGLETTWDDIADTIISEIPIDDYLFPLREDQQRFYIYDEVSGEDQLLHNFDLGIGDQPVGSNSCTDPQPVTEIELLTFGTEMRNKFSLFSNTSTGMTSLYEGIGSTRGLFVKPCTGMASIESGSKILCYTTNNQTIILDSFFSCETSTTVNIEELLLHESNVYPNPFDEKIVIENLFPNSNDTEIKLFDLQGKLIKSISNIGKEEQVEILTSGLSSGVYVLRISSKNNVYSTKLVKL